MKDNIKLHKSLPINNSGRDFVMGDLHGQADLLIEFLKYVQFDGETDRLISVGDLVDRGPCNMECLFLLEQSWFFSVKGNHEQLMQDFILGGPTGLYWEQNGGSWYTYLTNKSEVDWVNSLVSNTVVNMPLGLTVSMVNGKVFHVMHAEFLTKDILTDLDFQDEDRFKELATEVGYDGGYAAIWARRLFNDIIDQKLTKEQFSRYLSSISYKHVRGENLSTIYCGHSPVVQPTKIGAMINLDTRAYAVGKRPWCGLTVTEPLTGKFWKVTDDINEVELLQ